MYINNVLIPRYILHYFTGYSWRLRNFVPIGNKFLLITRKFFDPRHMFLSFSYFDNLAISLE